MGFTWSQKKKKKKLVPLAISLTPLEIPYPQSLLGFFLELTNIKNQILAVGVLASFLICSNINKNEHLKRWSTQSDIYRELPTFYRTLGRKESRSAFCMNWEINRSWGYEHTISPSVDSLGNQGARPLKNLQYLA